MIPVRKKVVAVALVAAALIGTAVLCRALRPGTRRIEAVLAAFGEQETYSYIALEYPFDGTLFPPEVPPPTFRWNDSSQASRGWLVRVTVADGGPDLRFLVRQPQWTPGAQDWESLKRRSLERDARVLILGVGPGKTPRILSRAEMAFRTSKDPVGAPLFYREVILPFAEADKDPSRIRWRFGAIDSLPPVVSGARVGLCQLPLVQPGWGHSRDG